MKKAQSVFHRYFQLIKSLQTILLTVTGLSGYLSACCPVIHGPNLLGVITSLVLTISGSTVLNMWYDRDIDRVMDRTHHRPLAQGTIPQRNALIFGLALSVLGTVLGVWMSPLYGMLLFAGIFLDAFVYTIWLKRRTCWSVVWGGIAGGMPVLAGRTLGMGGLDGIGVLLALAVLFWIPTHMLTFSIRYDKDYRAARIPTFPSTYGESVTRKVIALSSVIAGGLISLAAILIQVRQGFLHTLGVLSGGLIILAFLVMIKPSNRLNFGLFKYASAYMLLAMLLLFL